MKVLLDRNVPAALRLLLPQHEVETALSQQWDQLKNGQLISAAENAQFQCLLTADQNIFYQQNNRKRHIALVVLDTNYWRWIQPAADLIHNAVARSKPGSYELLLIKPTSR